MLQCSEDVIAPECVGRYVHEAHPGQHVHPAGGHRALPAPERAGGDDGRDPGLPVGVSRHGADRQPGRRTRRAQLGRLLEEDPADLYENAPMGYLSTLPDGRIVKVNRTFCAWTGPAAEDLLGTRFQDLLTVGGRVFHETHLAPLLRMQGAVREIALDVVRVDGSLLPCLLNAVELRDDDGAPVLVRATLFEATARRRYERELLAAQRAAEESEARSRTLQQVVSDLAAATSVEDVATVIVERSRAALRRARRRPGAGRGRDAPGPDDAARHCAPCASEGLPADLLRGAPGGGRRAAGPGAGAGRADRRRSTSGCGRRSPAVAAAMADAGLSGLVIVPVTADSRRLGVLVLGLGDGGGRPDQPGGAGRAAGDLAPADVDLLWTLGRQAGQALERARLHEQTARQAERAAFLLEAARLLAEAADVTETVERLAAAGRGPAGRPLRHRPGDRAGPDPGRRRGTATRPASTWPTSCASGTCRSGRRPHPSVQALQRGRHAVGARRWTTRTWRRSPSDERHLEVARALRADQHRRACRWSPRAAGWACVTLATDRAAEAVHRGRRRGRRAAGAAGVARGRQGAAVRARRPHVAHPAGQPAAAGPAGGARACRRRCATWRRRTGWRSAATSTTSSGCRTTRWRSPSGTSSATTSPPRRRWASSTASTGRCWWTGRRRAR